MVVHDVRADSGDALLKMLATLRQGGRASTDVTVRVLAAADHDGVCSSKILEAVLELADVKFTIVPVSGNSEIVEHLMNLEEDEEVRCVVLLNCGGGINLQRQLEECGAPDNLVCYVVDSHRPFLLANLSESNQNIHVIDDDPIAELTGERPPIDAMEASDASDDAASEAGSDEGQEDQWDAAGGGRADAQAEARRARKRRRQEREERREKKRQRINEYYQTSYYATPSALSLFKMARQAALVSQDMLWLAAVSLSGYHDLGLVQEVEYNRVASEELKEALDRTNDFAFSSSFGSTLPDSVGGTQASDDESAAPGGRQFRAPRAGMSSSKRRLRFEPDLRLTLYKHWTLEDSMYHSSYFYGALELNRDKGVRRIKNFFAVAGVPPSDYKQICSCMNIKVRKTIQKKFREHGRQYGLIEREMFLHQFIRDLGPLGDTSPALFLHELSSRDAAHVVTAMLSNVPNSLSSARMGLLPQTADGRRDDAAVAEMEKKAMHDNFYRAWEAVLGKEPAALKLGVEEAMESMKAVQSLARLIKDTKAMHKCRHFHWCKIEQPPHLFRHHLSVRRLAVWLLHVLFTFRPQSDSKELPLLVIVRDQVKDVYLCVGATPPRLSEQDEFGNLFRSVLRTDPSLKYRYDFFDKACIEIAADDFDRFWELMVSGS